jgi:uncharacterized short protein YbdD (DUF466 family)
MKRRAFLRSTGVAATIGTTGCLGMGGEAIVTVQESVRVEPGSYWVEEVPDVSDPGGAISYTVRSNDRRFDVYFFVGQDEYEHYEAHVQGEEPDETPAGHEEFSKAAVPKSDAEETFEAATQDGGAREPLDATGPYYFVVDHSSYRMENRVEEFADPLAAFVDLEVVRHHI